MRKAVTNAYNARAFGDGRATQDLSFLLHTIYGANAYPNYLAERFAPPHEADTQLARYEQLLQRELDRVAEAREARARRIQSLAQMTEDTAARLDTVLHSAVTTLHNSDLVNALAGGDDDDIRDQVTPVLAPDDAGYAPVSFPVLPEALCNELRDAFGAVLDVSRVTAVDELGPRAKQLVDTLFTDVLRPLTQALWGRAVVSDVDMRYSFIAYYRNDGQAQQHIRLPAHTDDSEVTLTLQLGGSWTEGGGVLLRNLRSTPSEGKAEVAYPHTRVGWALLHSGRHLHEVLPVTSEGDRMVLVLWARSQKHRSTHCPCCTMFDRKRCVMSPDWRTPEDGQSVYS